MIKIYQIFIVLWLYSIAVIAGQEVGLDYYFPGETSFDPGIPAPEEILGFQIGEKHVSHDQLVKYLYTLAENSDRIKIERYGWTYEHRPLLLLTVSSPENLDQIETIRNEHLALSDPAISKNLEINGKPVVVWMGYSVHGNEPSGLNASLLVAYYLAAAQTSEINDILNNTVILIDPSINPDGYSRFEQWVNQYKSQVLITDPNNLEHNESWPGGRTNHYWFDLNRDWLPLQHPESKARIEQFYRWKPNILTDHHEMGSNSTFFFQPGIPSRVNPNTPAENISLTTKIANYHAQGLDEIGSLYYSKESFDDFYYGKGSTYPDVNGGIGILFEQASSRGHARQTDNGVLTFPFTIRNQLTVSLSTIRAGFDLRSQLLEFQRDFYIGAINEASKKEAPGAYVFQCDQDRSRMNAFLEILGSHRIDVYEISGEISYDNQVYRSGNAYLVPLAQKQYRLIKTLFERSTSFSDSLFYDVSTWTFPLAFDLNYHLIEGKSFSPDMLGKKLEDLPDINGSLQSESDFAYLMPWNDYAAPGALYLLMKNNLRVKVAMKSFQIQGGKSFAPGTIVIPVQNQTLSEIEVTEIIKKTAKQCHIDFHGVNTGLNMDGIDLGSPNIAPLEKPRAMMIVGNGVSSYEAGEVWHLLDYKYRIPLSLVDIDGLASVNLNRYNTIIMVSGYYNGIPDSVREKLKTWLNNGGKIIAIKNGAKWLIDQKMAQIRLKKINSDSLVQRNYGDMDLHLGAQSIGGAIFEARIDLTHPLCYGYSDNHLNIFKNSRLFFEKSRNPYNNPVVYIPDPLASGYISKANYELIKNSSGLMVSSMGNGKIICFSEDPNFRAFWLGTNRLFFNAFFLGDLIDRSSTR